MRFFKPTLGRLCLTFFLSFNVICDAAIWSFFGIDIFSTSFHYMFAPHYLLYYLVIIILSYLFACIATLKMPHFWQPTLQKILLALVFEFVLFVAFILTLFMFNAIDLPSTVSQLVHSCSPGLLHDCINPMQTAIGRTMIFISALVFQFVTYTLSCISGFVAHKLKKQQGKRKH